jgi:hypothetical protein
MSIVVKKIPGGKYLYFQTYQDGKKREVYLGRADDVRAWIKGRNLLSDYKAKQIEDVDSQIIERMKLTRRRLLQSPEEVQSREELTKELESILSQRPQPTVAYHPLLRQDIERLLEELKRTQKRS